MENYNSRRDFAADRIIFSSALAATNIHGQSLIETLQTSTIKKDTTMTSSRIFVRGLPPNMSEDQFRKHFSSPFTVTDVKLIPQRRIGYVGYKSPEDATKAVKYFNKSYIRMSRIFVELARPVCFGKVSFYLVEWCLTVV